MVVIDEPPAEKPGKPVGVLRPTAGAGLFRVARYLPSAVLAPYVEHYWVVRWDLRGREPYVQETLPHPCVHLVVERGHSALFGVVRGRFTKRLEGAGRAFGIRFRAGGFAPFWPAPVSALTGRTPTLGEAFGEAGGAYERDVLAREDDASLVALAESFLGARLPRRADAQVGRIVRAVERITGDRAVTRVEVVAREMGVSARTVQRLFRAYVGVSPKWVICRQRLHDAAERLASGEVVDWPRLALELGYFDQAHFIRDFKAMVGVTPADYARGVAEGAAGARDARGDARDDAGASDGAWR